MKGLYHAGLAIVLTIIYTLQVVSLADEPNGVFVLILFTFCAVLGLVLLLVKGREGGRGRGYLEPRGSHETDPFVEQD